MALQGIEGIPVCMVCLDKEDPYHHFVCSVEGCGGTPVYMVVMERGDNSPALLCDKHFKEADDDIMSYVGIPDWLTEMGNFHRDDDRVELDVEVQWDADEGPLTALTEVRSGPPHNVRP